MTEDVRATGIISTYGILCPFQKGIPYSAMQTPTLHNCYTTDRSTREYPSEKSTTIIANIQVV